MKSDKNGIIKVVYLVKSRSRSLKAFRLDQPFFIQRIVAFLFLLLVLIAVVI